MALDVQPDDVDAGEAVRGRVAGPAQADHRHGSSAGDEQFSLAANPRVLVVIRVHDHQDGTHDPPRGVRGHDREPHPAPSRRTCPSRVLRPLELSTVSTMSSASA